MSIVIYPPTLDWGWMKQRPQHLMRQLAAAGHTVYYCNKTQSPGASAEEIEPRLHLVRDHEYWLNGRFRELAHPRRRREPVIVWCSLPFQLETVRRDYAPDLLIYDCADECPEWLAYENTMAAAADLIVCSSGRLLARLRRSYPDKRIILVRNGYDPGMGLHLPEADSPAGNARTDNAKLGRELLPGMFGRRGLPAETGPVGRERQIGYVGAWAPWIDTAVVRDLFSLGVQIVVIGAEFGRKYWPPETAGLVRFLGLKQHEELPGYIRRFDVCIIPFRRTPIALAANPIKAYEYLAAGKPVVSTDLPECRLMAPHVDVASTRRDFVSAVRSRLERPGEAGPRRRFALDNTWERRGAEIDAHIRELALRREAWR